MTEFQAQVNSPTGTVTVGSGTINSLAPLTVTEDEANFLRGNYAGVTVTEVKPPAKAKEEK